MAPSGDPMSGLLSGVGGIDASLFQRPQAMKDMKAKPGAKASPADASKASSAPAQPSYLHSAPEPTPPSRASNTLRQPEPPKNMQDRKPGQPGSVSPSKDPFSDASFSGLLRDGNFSKQGRRVCLKAAGRVGLYSFYLLPHPCSALDPAGQCVRLLKPLGLHKVARWQATTGQQVSLPTLLTEQSGGEPVHAHLAATAHFQVCTCASETPDVPNNTC